MIIDCHCHVFTKQVIRNVTSRAALVEELQLGADVLDRSDPLILDGSARECGVGQCLLLPTAAPEKVREENDRHLATSAAFPRLRALATLHPRMDDLAGEAARMLDRGVPGFKFSSFSQRFDVAGEDTDRMLEAILRVAAARGREATIVLDTFNRADVHFGAEQDHIATPAKLAALVRRHPGVRFLMAHMGGLAAGFGDLRHHLRPAPNLYLDTSNAAHTLTASQFSELLRVHGPDHILFGTDWPWFDHAAEIPVVDGLLDRAGFGPAQKDAVFHGNAERLFP
jgi:predicted TIM-barrel fold metal-dependent hydrolase